MNLLNLSERFIIYITEQSFLISITSMISLYFHIKAAFLGFFEAYRIDFYTGFMHIFDTYYGLLNILILFIVSLLYYTIESLTGKGIAEFIFKQGIINKYNVNKRKYIKLLLIRDIIKAFFISNIINSSFILLHGKMLQNEYDYKNNIFTIKNNEENKKSLFFQYFYTSVIIYYSIFFILLFTYTFVIPVSPLTSSGDIKSKSSFNYWSFFHTILSNNMTLDVFEYIIGGFSLFAGTFIALFSSNILETVIMASLDSAHGYVSFVKYILPQFFPETLGYVFGLSTAMVITDAILSYIQSAIRNEKSGYFLCHYGKLGYIIITYIGLSLLLLFIGALIEAALGIYNF